MRNIVFCDFRLRLLRQVYGAQKAGRPFMTVEVAVHRLTRDLAQWYDVDAGHLRLGDRADLVVIDPAHLDESLDTYAEGPITEYNNLSRILEGSCSLILPGSD